MNYCSLKIWFCIVFNLTIVLNGCAQTETKTDTLAALKIRQSQNLVGNFSSQTRIAFDSTELASFFIQYPKLKRFENDVWHFYRKRNFTFAWFENGILIEQAGNLINRVLNLEDEGVFKKLSYAASLDSLAHGEKGGYKSKKSNIQLELLLTAEYFVFSNLAWQGMDPFVSTANNWYLPRKKIAYDLYLDSLLNIKPQVLSLKEPVYRQYELLKSFLIKYREFDDQNWPIINDNAKSIKTKDSALVISQVKRRLLLLGDYTEKLTDTLADEVFKSALIRFQERHGLEPTGLINRETISALNVPLKSRIMQLLVNMERSRWLPVANQDDYLAVNIPEFKLHVYHDEDLLWSCGAVVGKTIHPTTLFFGQINQIVFSPYWNVPESIVVKEILPGIRKDQNYLNKQQMEITGYRNGLPVIRQKPGPSNSLGQVKFLFPNSYSIYLHDTPSKSLFNETDRAFSHGCIRIAQPAKLAAFLLKDRIRWNENSINKAMQSGKEQVVILDQKIPVFIVYFTAFVDRNDKLNFRKDIYALDERLGAMLISRDQK